MSQPEEAAKFLEIIGRHTQRLISIIEDLLTLSRIEQEEGEPIGRQITKIKRILESAVQICHFKAENKNIAVTVEGPESFEACVNGALLEQALVNLVDNAIKYSDSGKAIVVRLETMAEQFIIHVQDEGIGIPREHHGRLFERFYRVDKARSRKLGGTGLGLAIVKHIAKSHGGNISVKSAPARGSTFSMSLPVNLAADDDEQ